MTAHSVVWPPSALDPLAGLPCNSIRTGNDHLIVLGFGNLIATRSATGEIKERSSWRIGTVNCGWRVVKDDVILVGTTDPDHHWCEINVKLSSLTLGAFRSLEHVGR